jgi:hypothetical protein
MAGEGANRLRAGRYSRHRPDGEPRGVPENRMLCRWTALRRCAIFPIINSILSNANEPRPQKRHLVGFSMENRPPISRRDGASELPLSNEGFK